MKLVCNASDDGGDRFVGFGGYDCEVGDMGGRCNASVGERPFVVGEELATEGLFRREGGVEAGADDGTDCEEGLESFCCYRLSVNILGIEDKECTSEILAAQGANEDVLIGGAEETGGHGGEIESPVLREDGFKTAHV